MLFLRRFPLLTRPLSAKLTEVSRVAPMTTRMPVQLPQEHLQELPSAATDLIHYNKLNAVDRSAHLFSEMASQELKMCLEDPQTSDEQHKYNRATQTLKLVVDMFHEGERNGPLSLSNAAGSLLVDLALQTKNERDLFQLLLMSNIDITRSTYSRLRTSLRKGSQEDRTLYEFSGMFSLEDDAELQHAAKSKFVSSYSFQMINQIVIRYIQLGEPLRANQYLELLISKHSLNKEHKRTTKMESSQLYETISYLTVRHGHYKTILSILRQMSESSVEMTPKLFTIFVTSLRHKKQYDAILVILRAIPELFEDAVSPKAKSILINELLRLIRDKFPDEAKVFLAHFVEIYPSWGKILDDLGLTGMVYLRSVKKLPLDFDLTQAAVNEFYRLETPSNENVTELYSAVLNHMSHHGTNTAHNLGLLFKRYIQHITRTHTGPFKKTKMDAVVLELFIKHAIAIRQPKLAFFMLKSFLSQVSVPNDKFNKGLITYVFHHHGMTKQQAQFAEMTSMLAQYNVPVDFNMLCALVLKDLDNSKFWFDKLVQMGYSVQLAKLRNKAIREGWELEEEEEEKEPRDENWGQHSWNDEGGEDDDEFVAQLEAAMKELCT